MEKLFLFQKLIFMHIDGQIKIRFPRDGAILKNEFTHLTLDDLFLYRQLGSEPVPKGVDWNISSLLSLLIQTFL